MKFKTGDKVINRKTGELNQVVAVPGMIMYDSMRFEDAHKGFLLDNNEWEYQEDWKLVTPKKRKVTKKLGRPRKVIKENSCEHAWGKWWQHSEAYQKRCCQKCGWTQKTKIEII